MPTERDKRFFDALEATWPAANTRSNDGWMLRQGLGGGKRVSAATATRKNSDIEIAEQGMMDLGQTPLFMIAPGEQDLDEALAARGYELVDPVVIYSVAVDDLTNPDLSPTAAIPAWPPLKVMEDIWAEGGVGPERLAVMDRVTGGKTGIIARDTTAATGTAFVAADEEIAMIHAIEVQARYRGQGHGRKLIQRAAAWAARNDATQLALAVTKANTAANGLYRSLGMVPVTAYHYRMKTA